MRPCCMPSRPSIGGVAKVRLMMREGRKEKDVHEATLAVRGGPSSDFLASVGYSIYLNLTSAHLKIIGR